MVSTNPFNFPKQMYRNIIKLYNLINYNDVIGNLQNLTIQFEHSLYEDILHFVKAVFRQCTFTTTVHTTFLDVVRLTTHSDKVMLLLLVLRLRRVRYSGTPRASIPPRKERSRLSRS